jgi:hypothetical protein
MHNLDEQYEWVGTREASARLGVSSSTVEGMIRKGALQRSVSSVPAGPVCWSDLTDPQEPPQAASDDVDPIESADTPEPRQVTFDAMTGLLAANAETIERQAQQITALSERAGRAEVERDLLRDELERARARRWWRWW